jgi:hypothetical protein
MIREIEGFETKLKAMTLSDLKGLAAAKSHWRVPGVRKVLRPMLPTL